MQARKAVPTSLQPRVVGFHVSPTPSGAKAHERVCWGTWVNDCVCWATAAHLLKDGSMQHPLQQRAAGGKVLHRHRQHHREAASARAAARIAAGAGAAAVAA